MGIPGVRFFGDKTKEEIKKKIRALDAKIEKNLKEKAELEAELKKYEDSNKG